ncbi:MAG: response regulator [Cytophagales bacterium]|nr:response regulator [Cytophagales bacterium]
MQPLLDATVYIVDDDASVREALAWMLRTRRLHNESFASADKFLADINNHFAPTLVDPITSKTQYAAKHPSCLLLDVRMPHMSGLELFNELLAHGLPSTLPVIFLTGHADVPTAVDTVKRGAFDFCEKPFSNNLLVDRIEAALQLSSNAVTHLKAQQHIQQKIAALTEREQSVMQHVIEGLPNKLIADQLGISMRTVEVHRARVFDKMGVNSAVELANLIRVQA